MTMLSCAYCDETCKPTREHVIPDWYSRTPGDASTFNARSPHTQLRGALLVKDVCERCNNEILGPLDEYGKELYDRYFSTPLYAGEQVEFEYDGDRLIRWLLKLSYNSARAQKSDIRQLREYRNVMLGREVIPARIRCWIGLVTPTIVDDNRDTRPAKRDEINAPTLVEPLWFRISQFRLPFRVCDTFVQRIVLINSYSFTILAAPPEADWPDSDANEWCDAFAAEYTHAIPIVPGNGRLIAKTATEHVGTSLYPFMWQYPTRYIGNPFPELVKAAKGEVRTFFLQVIPEMINELDTRDIAMALHFMISTRENAMGMKQTANLMVSGYDDDPRQLWEIREVREFFRLLFIQCPFVYLLAYPGGALLKVLFLCWIYEEGSTDEELNRRGVEFQNCAFQALNDLCYRLALTEEINRQASRAATETLLGLTNPS